MSGRLEPRVVKAPNPGPFTLDGTRTFLVGHEQVAVIDPGPDVEDHVRALRVALGGAREVRVLLTHHHKDHAGAARALAAGTGATVHGPPGAGVEALGQGDVIPTDAGELEVLAIPGHTRDHLAFHWLAADALFVGDLILGRGNTTWLGEYAGCVTDYLDSLTRVRDLGVSVLYPAHGPPVSSPSRCLEIFEAHRHQRIQQLRDARRAHPHATAEELARAIYGSELPPRVAKAARSSVEVMLYHLEGAGEGDG